MRDAARVAVHLVTLARDYDPFKQTPAQAISSIVKVTPNPVRVVSADDDEDDCDDE